MKTTQFRSQLLNMQDHMKNFAMMLTANVEDAEDLMQDTTLKVLNNQEKFVDNVNFKGWVFTVMRNIFINNYHRVVRTQTVIDSSIDPYNVDIPSDSGFNNPEGSMDLQEISGAINNLSKDLKIPFSMYLSGYKYNEVAQHLDLPLGTVKSRIFFARQELKEKLSDFK